MTQTQICTTYLYVCIYVHAVCIIPCAPCTRGPASQPRVLRGLELIWAEEDRREACRWRSHPQSRAGWAGGRRAENSAGAVGVEGKRGRQWPGPRTAGAPPGPDQRVLSAEGPGRSRGHTALGDGAGVLTVSPFTLEVVLVHRRRTGSDHSPKLRGGTPAAPRAPPRTPAGMRRGRISASGKDT